MSSLAMLVYLLLSPATAHEVSPSIADLRTDAGQAQLSLRLNIEAFLAGINLDGLQDTNAAAQSARYDNMRFISPPQLESMIRQQWPEIGQGITLLADQNPVELTLGAMSFQDPGDPELPRFTFLELSGEIPSGAQSLTLGWAKGYGTLILRQQGVDSPYTGYIEGGQTSAPITLTGGSALSPWQSFLSYIPVGFTHILPMGLDHILFVLGLFFLSLHWRPLLWQISAFTLAHTVTLAMGAAGWVNLPASVVEPLIAASICWIAVENLRSENLSRWRPLVIFGFGLLHGLGFASVLEEFGLPEDRFLSSLLGFNLGVEFGQLTVVAVAFLAVGLWFGRKPWYRARISQPASVVIALIGAWWVIERVFL